MYVFLPHLLYNVDCISKLYENLFGKALPTLRKSHDLPSKAFLPKTIPFNVGEGFFYNE